MVNHFDNRYSSPSIEGRRCSLPSVTRFIVFNTMCQLKSTSLVCHKAEILVVCKKRWKLFSCMRLPVLLHLNICLNLLHHLLSRILLLIRNRNLLLSLFQNPPQNQIQNLSRISNPLYIFNQVPASSDNVNWDWGTRIYNNVIKLIRIIE